MIYRIYYFVSKFIIVSNSYPEVVSPHAIVLGVLVAKMSQLLVQNIRVKGHVDGGIQTIGDTDTVSSELWAVGVSNIDIGKQVLGGWFLVKESRNI